MLAAANLSFDIGAGGAGQSAGFFLLAGFILSFLLIRVSVRLMRSPKVPWWPGSVTSEGGLHVHHLVFGVFIMCVTGFLGFALDMASPGEEIVAALFGIGAGLTLDEFALILHLDDVYWSETGRQSVDAVLVCAALGGLFILGLPPLGTDTAGPVWVLVATIAVNITMAAITMLKGKLLTGAIGVFVPIVALVSGCRLARPGSPWAYWFYRSRPAKMERAKTRYLEQRAHWGQRRRKFMDAIAGAPDPEHPRDREKAARD